MKVGNILTVSGAVALIVMLVLCTVNAVESTAAFITAWPAREQLDNWREKQRHMDHAQWVAIQSQIEHALQYTPDDPELLRNLGLAHEAEFNLYPSVDRSAKAEREMAGKYYQQTILLRPSWPYDRIDLALVKFRMNESDRNIYTLMTQATELGPWEPRVQQVVAEIGLRQWESLPDDIREVVLETVNNGVLHGDNTTGMLNLLRRYDMAGLVCDKQYEQKEIIDFCKRYNKD